MKTSILNTSAASNSSITRRGFIAGATGAGILTASGWSPTALATETPKSGGHMILAMGHGAATDSYNPARSENNFQGVVILAMTDTLTEIAPSGDLIPSIASSWDGGTDARIWTFQIRKNITFHNGKNLKANDVVASINHHRGENSESAVRPIAQSIVQIEAPDDQTVTIELAEGNADFPYNLALPQFAVFQAKEDGSLDWQSGIGVGGYQLKEFEPGVKASFVKNTNYWKPGRAHADSVDILVIHDISARTNALLTGAVQAIDKVDPKTARLLSRKPGMKVEETAGPLHYTFPMRTDMGLFKDNNVRLALKYAIDRQEILDKVLRGHGTIGNDNPIGPSYRNFASEISPRSYDPEKAKYHLKQAGAEGLTVDLSAADAAFAGAVDAAVLYKGQAARAGININVVREPNDGYWSNVWMKKPFCACYWGGYSTEDTMFSTGYAQTASWNDTFWQHERFNRLLKEARPLLDKSKRREIYTEMQLIIRDEGGVIVPFFANAIMASSEKIAHGTLGSDRDFDGARIVERWWLS
ncbi:ABC transporter substrate-binding protein [Kiloniella laminariae]|uniref:ABC transporter substrate-binding protein n=1 Tax=Kiloniella laminariae TaxID=454162 RepID=A0ABT4LP98_9PROT|nr:ABC transporter substrate-binding protein [Kiloniella laminariae]MCZ4282136.1 ABC transporter substrate-binding protein [Kiloniella laminariae]